MQSHPEIQPSHLTDEQFADLLLGSESASVQAHLKACSQCVSEADRLSGAIGDFNTQSRLWAERQAAVRPILSPDRQSAFTWLHRPQAWAAAALAVALAAGIGVSALRDHTRAAQTIATQSSIAQSADAQAQPAAQVTPATLKADNELLSAIDGELQAVDESTPASEYRLSTTSNEDMTKQTKRTTNE